MATQEIDGAAAEQFAGRMVGVLNDAMLGLQMSVGQQVGLYELLSGLEPATAEAVRIQSKIQRFEAYFDTAACVEAHGPVAAA